VSAETAMTLARAEMGRKPLDQGLSPRFEKHEVVLQFDMSQLHSQFHQLKSPVNMPFVMWIIRSVDYPEGDPFNRPLEGKRPIVSNESVVPGGGGSDS